MWKVYEKFIMFHFNVHLMGVFQMPRKSYEGLLRIAMMSMVKLAVQVLM